MGLGGLGGYVGGLGRYEMVVGDCEGTAVMRESARNARLMSQMVYAIWFSF